MISAGRIRCCIPGCGRTFKSTAHDEECICRRHWRMADTRLRTRHRQVKTRIRKLRGMWDRRHLAIERSGRYVKFVATLQRAYMQNAAAWVRVKEDITIKAAFGVEDAPRRRRAA